MNKLTLSSAMIVLLGSMGSAVASNTWLMNTGSFNGTDNTNGEVYSVAAQPGIPGNPGGYNLGITGWANTRGTSNYNQGSAPNQIVERQGTGSSKPGMSYSSGYGLQMQNNDACGSGTAYSSCTSGSGYTQRGDSNEGLSGEHAIDNQGRNEMVLANFGSEKVNLTNVSVGWNGSDNGSGTTAPGSDMTIWAYVGSKTSINDIMGYSTGGSAAMTWANLFATNAGADWKLIGNYKDVGLNADADTGVAAGVGGSGTKYGGGINFAGDSVGVFSSFWLIGAYNPLGLPPSSTGLTKVDANTGARTTVAADSIYDSFKLQALKGCVKGKDIACPTGGGGNVPEPGSAALMGVALLGLLASRKRVKMSA